MQRLERLLSTNLAILAVIGAVMLGLGQQDPKLPLLVFISALASVVYTDRRKVFSLNHHIANLAALGAVGLALVDFSASDRNNQLLAIANLLVYLQVVVFFQEKNARIFGQLAMLSLLQVVVAAALNYSIFFGVLILAYMGIGLPTLSLFFFYRELSRFVVVNETRDGQMIGLDPAAATLLEQKQTGSPKRKPRRWPLIRQEAIFSGADFQKHEEAFGKGGLLAFTTRMSMFTLLLTLALFIFAPRFGRTPWQATALEPTRIVGYSEEVSLGKSGSSTENPQTVMRVSFVNAETEQMLRLSGSPLFRGTVLTDYNLEDDRWSQRRGGSGSGVVDLDPIPRNARGVVRQEITLEPSEDTTAFAVYPAYAKNPNSSIIKYDENRRQLFRIHSEQQSKFNIWTTGIDGTLQKDIRPAGKGIGQFEIRHLLKIPRGEGGAEPFAGLRRVADEAIAASGVDPEDSYQVAIALERFMLSQGGFKYSLEGQELPKDVDPIEDFVTRTRVGHCEYFASALTLMLRHRGIPARIVVGFKGGDWNPIGSFYQVRQLHAHAWVEAYFKRAQLESNEIDLGRNNFGAWVTLDSTADTLANSQLQGESWWSQIKTVADYVEMQWITYVIGFSQEQQQEHIYNPLKDAIAEVTKSDQRNQPQQAKVPWYWKVIYFLKAIAGGNWFSVRGFLVSFGLLALLVTMVYVIGKVGRPLFNKLRVWWETNHTSSEDARRTEVVFYRQLETLLKKHGYQREVGQTQLEFANHTGVALAERQQAAAVSPLPREVTNAFYAVRFGGKTLNPQQTEKVEQALVALEAALAEKPEAHPPSQSNGHSKQNGSRGTFSATNGHPPESGNGTT